MVMPTVISRNAALGDAGARIEVDAQAERRPVTVADLEHHRRRAADRRARPPPARTDDDGSRPPTSSVAITSLPCRPSPIGRADRRRRRFVRDVSCGSSTRSRPGTTNSDTASSATVTTARCTCTLTSARFTSTVMMPPVTPPRLHSPCSRFITGRATACAEHRALHVHRDVDEDVEEQQADQADDQHRRRRSRSRRSAASRST